MKKQKICIIGGSLTGLVTAISLSKLGCEIDLVIHNFKQNLKSKKTVAISESNFGFLNDLEISTSLKKQMWACSKMKLYSEIKKNNFSEIFELNKENKQEKILYMFENYKIIKLMMNKIKKIKSISLIYHKKISSIFNEGLLKGVRFTDNNTRKYNLVIICTGYNSDLAKNIFDDQIIKNSYEEYAITTILKHSPIKNNISRQIFLENEILALLPLSNIKTSIVWTVKKCMKKKNKIFFKNKINYYAKKYLNNINFSTDIECNDLNLLIRNKYYTYRTLLFGDALHVMHPFVGQSFNMTLRDLISLKKILKKKMSLGLDIGSTDILSEYSREIKPRNFVFSIGSDLLKNSLSYKSARNDILKILNKSNFSKDILFNIADKGFRF